MKFRSTALNIASCSRSLEVSARVDLQVLQNPTRRNSLSAKLTRLVPLVSVYKSFEVWINNEEFMHFLHSWILRVRLQSGGY